MCICECCILSAIERGDEERLSSRPPQISEFILPPPHILDNVVKVSPPLDLVRARAGRGGMYIWMCESPYRERGLLWRGRRESI